MRALSRRLRRLALSALLVAALTPTCRAAGITRVESVGMTVSDLDRAVSFYTEVLPFKKLTEYLAPRGHPVPAESRSNDRWFQHVALIVSDMDRAYALLRSHNVEYASSAPQRLPDWNPKAGGI